MSRTLYFLDYWWDADDMLGNWVTVGVYSSDTKARAAHRKHQDTEFRKQWQGDAPEEAKTKFEERMFVDERVRLRPVVLDAAVDEEKVQ